MRRGLGIGLDGKKSLIDSSGGGGAAEMVSGLFCIVFFLRLFV